MSLENTRLLIVVEDADYREALSEIFMPERLDEKLSGRVSPVEIHMLKAAVLWSEQIQEVAIFSCYSNEKYSQTTYLNVRIMGSGVSRQAATSTPSSSRPSVNFNQDLIRLIADFCPSRIVVSCQSPAVIRWAVRNRIPTLALLSDWQEPLGFWRRWQHRQYIRDLNHPSVNWVGAQGVQSSRILADSGIESRKLIPWEWAQPQLLHQYAPKKMREHHREIELVYVGELDEKTGIEDLLKAVTYLQRNRYRVSLNLVRNTLNYTHPIEANETLWLQVQVQRWALADSVSVWAGLAPEQMLERVQAADLLIVPRPPKQKAAAPPLAVSLAMAACTPMVACDHPALDDHLFHGVNVMSFPVGNPKSMAHRIERMMTQPVSYAQLSASSHMALSKIKVPARWGELIDRWISGKVYDQQWLSDFALSSGRYKPLKVERNKLRLVIPDVESDETNRRDTNLPDDLLSDESSEALSPNSTASSNASHGASNTNNR